MMLSLSNLLLVFNSSVNFIIYCFVEESFQDEVRKLLIDAYKRVANVVGLPPEIFDKPPANANTNSNH